MTILLDKKNMDKKNMDKQKCHKCEKNAILTRVSFRWTDKKRVYKGSKRAIINSAYTFVCAKCLLVIIK